MKYVIFTHSFESGGIAKRLLDEGNQVVIAVAENEKMVSLPEEVEGLKTLDFQNKEKEQRRLNLYSGIVDKMPALEAIDMLLKVPNPKEWFVFFDMNYLYKYASILKGSGIAGNYPEEEDRRLEVDRKMAKDFIKKYYPKVKIALNKEFKTVDEAIEFLKESDDLWVAKPFSDNARTIVIDSDNIELSKKALIESLKEQEQGYDESGFILEQKIIDPIEITPEAAWYNGKLLYASIDIENKKIAAGEKGGMVGCAQNLVYLIEPTSKIFKMAFPSKIFEMARQHEGLFIFDLSILFSSKTKQAFASEYCANRPGWDCFPTQLTQLNSASSYFEKVAKGENPFANVFNTFGVATRFFDFEADEIGLPKADKKITILDDFNSNVWFMDVIKKEGDLVTGGYMQDVGLVTGKGESIEKAVKDMQSTLNEIYFKDMYYRPAFDFLSKKYKNSIMNRYDWGKDNKLF